MPSYFRRTLAASAFLAAAANGSAKADPPTGPDYSALLFGDLGGFRPAFAKIGGALNLSETSEVFDNPFGGLRQGGAYDGLTTLTIQVDTKPFFKIDGGLFNVSGLQLHGTYYSATNIGALQIVSGVQGDRATRLWELWYQQKFNEHFDIRIGQQSLDVEFFTNPSGSYFVNSLFGFPALNAIDMPAGGPAYPLSALGARARYAAGDWTVLGGVFSGTPSPPTNPDPQAANPYGVSFPIRGALAVAEAQYAFNQGEGQYAGAYKFGGWYDTLNLSDPRYNVNGAPLGDPGVDPTPLQHRGDFALYAVGEQVVWRGKDKEQTLSLFLRPIVAPLSDRNYVTFGVNGGLALHDPLPGRNNDTFALGFGYVQVGAGAIGFATDAAAANPNLYTPSRSNESVFEATYQAQVTPWAQVQPDLQYIHNPGGGALNPLQPNQKIGDALVMGLRVNVNF